jgi:hypothetical protein
MDGQRQLPVAGKACFSSRIMLSNSPATGHVDRSYRRHVTASAVAVAVVVAVAVCIPGLVKGLSHALVS